MSRDKRKELENYLIDVIIERMVVTTFSQYKENFNESNSELRNRESKLSERDDLNLKGLRPPTADYFYNSAAMKN